MLVYNIISNFLNNLIVKTILLTVLPIAYGVFFPLSIENKDKWKNWNLILFVCIFLVIVHIILIVKYTRAEKRQSEIVKSNEKTPHELKRLKKIMKLANKIISDNSTKLYSIVKRDSLHRIHSDIIDWNWMQAKGDEIVNTAYEIIKDVSEFGNEFSVSIILKKREDNIDGFTMLSRCVYSDIHTPRIYRSFISNSDADKYFYKQLIDSKPTRPKILMDTREIEGKFQEYGTVKYRQYIAIPIACSGNNTIGILQIVGYNKSIISKDRKKIEELCDQYFMTLVNLLVLSDKSENIDQVVGMNNASRVVTKTI